MELLTVAGCISAFLLLVILVTLIPMHDRLNEIAEAVKELVADRTRAKSATRESETW
jgi:hypothetical protein